MVLVMDIYANGGCRRGSGQQGIIGAAAAASKSRYGAYFHARTLSLPPYPRPTYQRAVLTGIIMALQQALERLRGLFMNPSLTVKIYSDSRYAIMCMTDWRYKWAENGWITTAGKQVANRNLIEEAGNLEDRLKA